MSTSALPAHGVAFICPGQGSYSPDFLRALQPQSAELFEAAERSCRDLLGVSLLELLSASAADHDALLERSRGLEQVGIYLSSVLVAQRLKQLGLSPDVVVGHSAGELAALAVGGAYSAERGLEVVCRRVLALRSLGAESAGDMLSLSIDATRLLALLKQLGESSLQLAVENGVDQSVVSGTRPDVLRLASLADAENISHAPVRSRHPFHSQLMAPAVAVFAQGLGRSPAGRLVTPVYSPIEAGFYEEGVELAERLSTHFVRPLSWSQAIDRLYAQGVRTFVECGAGQTLTRLTRRILIEKRDVLLCSTSHPSRPPEMSIAEAVTACQRAVEKNVPIAIVSMGSVLPGSANPEAFWRQILAGTSGITDAGLLEPHLVSDFVAPSPGTPDKTYTLLCGSIANPTPAPLPFPPATLNGFSKTQRLLASAAAQCFNGFSLPASSRVRSFLGSTADGSSEYDEACLVASLHELADTLAASPQEADAFKQMSGPLFGRSLDDASRLAPHPSFQEVLAGWLGPAPRVLAVDAACASSLYAIDLGIKALRAGDCDVALSGGVFAPGRANTCLFAQFKGLSATGSRPFDATADGVIFGDGAALLALKRLPDALAAQDRIHGIIREVGTSSDGKSPSLMEPRKAGQTLAIQRSYARAGVDSRSIQYIEAHATATPRGDRVELTALGEVFQNHGAVEVGSIKGLIGHTGWVAGAASVIKICKALEHDLIPPQPNFSKPNPTLEQTGFHVSTSARPWPAAKPATARRAGINGFGFGGSNAHLILEGFDPALHRAKDPARTEAIPMAVVGVGSLFAGSALRFGASGRTLPTGMSVLPDVRDDMDAAQFLALNAAAQALQNLPPSWKADHDEVGVVIGIEGKTGRALEANQRVYADGLERRFKDWNATNPLAGLAKLQQAVLAKVRQLPPSGPYTLLGLMPNVVSGRVANMFDLKGPNMVVDAGSGSLAEALGVAEKLLRTSECKLVLAGGICGYAGPEHQRLGKGREVEEAALIVALAPLAEAKKKGYPILATLTLAPPSAPGTRAQRVGSKETRCLMGAEGARELTAALAATAPTRVEWGQEWAVAIEPTRAPASLLQCEPVLTEATLRSPPAELKALKILFLTGHASWFADANTRGALSGLNFQIACPADVPIPGALQVDLSSEQSAEAGLARIASERFDLVLAVSQGGTFESVDAICGPRSARSLLDLLFLVARGEYPRLASRDLGLLTLVLDARARGQLHPSAGLLGGFIKSLARELPSSNCTAISTDDTDFDAALAKVAREFTRPPDPSSSEVDHSQQVRRTFQLRPLAGAVSAGLPMLNSNSVVLATGGARGITGALMEALLRRYGCTLVLLGRTDPAHAPEEALRLDNSAFLEWETRFYRDEMARTPGAKMGQLKQRYLKIAAAREVHRTLARLSSFPGRVEYLPVDVSNRAEVDRALAQLATRHPAVDLVVHGAGVQVSRVMPKKSLEEFRRIVSTKLDGLTATEEAVKKHFPARPVHFHLLSSAVSFLGNDGQPDYGAANEAMNGFARAMAAGTSKDTWSTLAWLGWTEVGMASGSEYAALAEARGVRLITPKEGADLFLCLLEGTPVTPVNVLFTEGEAAHYGVKLLGSSPTVQVGEARWTFSLETHPWLADHRVEGTPTVPGAFEVQLAAEAALALRPGLTVTCLEDVRFDRFVKVSKARPFQLRAATRVLGEADGKATIEVVLLSDFVHASGRILNKDVRHFSAQVHLARSAVGLGAARPTAPVEGRLLRDPYVLHPDSPVKLDGFFRCLSGGGVRAASQSRSTKFEIEDTTHLPRLDGFVVPSVLLDGLCRVAVIDELAQGQTPLFVPLRCDRISFAGPFSDRALHGKNVRLQAGSPRRTGDELHNDWAEAVAADGQVLVRIDGVRAQRMGEVTFAPSSEITTRVDAERSLLWCEQRPIGLPCLTLNLMRDLETVRLAVERAEHPVRYAVLSSKVPGTFNLGGDLALIHQFVVVGDRAGLRAYAQRCIDCLRGFSEGFTPITVSLVQGSALAGGFEIALATDVLIAEESARFGLPEASFDWFPGLGAYGLLHRRIGHKKATELCLSGETHSARAMHAMGLIDVLVPDGQGEAAVLDYIESHRRKYASLRAITTLRRRLLSPPATELEHAAELWVDMALRSSQATLDQMNSIVSTQKQRALRILAQPNHRQTPRSAP